ncbi:MAG: type I methionyl aminopeptidase [Actinobacteria bacterium]|nr:type I methionyl aminopeptidase [Actinomycetota bacterium]
MSSRTSLRRSRNSRPVATQRPRGVVLKSDAEIEAMAAAGALLARCHRRMEALALVGTPLIELDRVAEAFIRANGAVPVFKGYNGFPGSICPSVNEEVVHAIPGARELADGDILSLDIGLSLDGWVADQARTLPIGTVSAAARRLIATTERGLQAGIAAAVPGGHLGDIGHAVQREVEAEGFSVVRALVGHGVGRSMHEEPQVPNFGRPGRGMRLEVGTVIAIEPMVNAGGPDIAMAEDGWTISSADGSLSAHAEHTVAITSAGPRILTIE